MIDLHGVNEDKVHRGICTDCDFELKLDDTPLALPAKIVLVISLLVLVSGLFPTWAMIIGGFAFTFLALFYIINNMSGEYRYAFIDRNGDSHLHRSMLTWLDDLKCYQWSGNFEKFEELSAEDLLIDMPVLRLAIGGWLNASGVFYSGGLKPQKMLLSYIKRSKTGGILVKLESANSDGTHVEIRNISLYEAIQLSHHYEIPGWMVQGAIDLPRWRSNFYQVREQREEVYRDFRKKEKVAESLGLGVTRILVLMRVLHRTMGNSLHAQVIRELLETSLEELDEASTVDVKKWAVKIELERSVWEEPVLDEKKKAKKDRRKASTIILDALRQNAIDCNRRESNDSLNTAMELGTPQTEPEELAGQEI